MFVGMKKENFAAQRLWQDRVRRVKSKNGYIGSGNWIYAFKGNQFEVNGYANGRGAWGTDYDISKRMPPSDES